MVKLSIHQSVNAFNVIHGYIIVKFWVKLHFLSCPLSLFAHDELDISDVNDNIENIFDNNVQVAQNIINISLLEIYQSNYYLFIVHRCLDIAILYLI